NPQNDKQLYSAIYNSMLKAHEYGLKSFATTAVATGLYSFPIDIAADLFFKAALQFFADYPDTSIETIRFTNYDEDDRLNRSNDKNTVRDLYKGFKKVFK